MKTTVIIAIVYIFSLPACEKKKHDSAQKFIDSMNIAIKADSIVEQSIKNVYFKDTAKLADAPVVVLKARPVEKEYSSYKDITLTYKNISGKKIDAIKFSWYGTDAFGEPADMGGFQEGFGGGFMDDGLGIGKTNSGTWGILSRNLKKVVKAWPTEVAFADGTSWKL